MKQDDIKLAIQDVVTFLNDLDRVLPGKVEVELLEFLNTVQDNEWTLDLLVNAIGQTKHAELPAARKRP